MNRKALLDVILSPFREWSKDNAPQLAAAIAYYTIFSISPLLIIALAIAGQFYNGDAARTQLMAQISGLMGPETASFVGRILENSARSSTGLLASIISFVVLLFGASGIFNQVQYALNKVWKVPANPQHSLMSNLKNRFLAFLMVLVIGLLLVIFLTISTVLSALNTYINSNPQTAWLSQTINLGVLTIIMTALFAIIFRTVPDSEITWADVWLGAGVTSVLFLAGRYAIGLYLQFSKSGSVYGAAGSLIILLIWIYYSAQIFLLGAEFTHVFARKFGSHRPGKENAEPNSETPGTDQEISHLEKN